MLVELRRIYSIAAEVQNELVYRALELHAHERCELGVVGLAIHDCDRRVVRRQDRRRTVCLPALARYHTDIAIE